MNKIPARHFHILCDNLYRMYTGGIIKAKYPPWDGDLMKLETNLIFGASDFDQVITKGWEFDRGNKVSGGVSLVR